MSQAENENALTPLPIPLKLRAGHTEVDGASGRAKLISAIEESNRKVRLEGLPDHLDPEIIDPEKAVALMRGLSKLPHESLQNLAGRTLFLNYPGLMIGASAPTTAATFSKPFKLQVVDTQGDVVLARALVDVDCALAHKLAVESRDRLKLTENEVKAAESQASTAPGTPDQEHNALVALSNARLRRFALAQVWEQNARIWSACPAAGKESKEDAEAAAHAVESYAVPRSGGMP